MAPLEGKGGACSIRLSEPLLKLRPRKDLVQTLLHEMIHAHLHVTKCRESDPHGPKFKEHMHRINKIAGTNITVYHNFHDEVNLHKQHWWRCNGHCRNWRPYYGWVKRATNRAPSKNDFWWAQHQQTCGGQYIKVKEPEGYSKKKEAQLQKSLGKNGNLLSMIKKKYNLNNHVSTVICNNNSSKMPKTKDLSDSDSDSGPEDRLPPPKKKKVEKKPEKKPTAKSSGSGDQENMFQLSKMRYATVSEFRGKVMVGIREYYEADGELRPGRKGISLNLEQWKRLKDSIPEIEEAIQQY
ncbi:SPRTN [Acanthosepion pharaonis]|uniref:SPRTN n=1 Tax=Acanthosepion pharaonis TaxID=158019 RepID=A0A812DFK7_ACAPH|nr:SPRTN [Sepia pharaonis]